MPITTERLIFVTEELHRAAEDNHRTCGFAASALMLVFASGSSELMLFPDGLPALGDLKAAIQGAAPVGIIVTTEVWVSTPGIRPETLMQMPFDDMPRPQDDPNRREAISTTGVGITPDGPINVLKISMIERHAHGSVLRPVHDIKTASRDGTIAFLTSMLM